MKIYANCKINIGLDILRRREDGFHDLSTIMYPIKGLYDELTIEATSSSDIEFYSVGIPIDCPAERNLCVRAARTMQQRYNTTGVRITLDKRVPFGAGLGGGSSDATAVLLAMNEIYSLHLSEEELISIAAELGSDTPFFVRNTPQICSGRGEIMSPIAVDLSPYKILLIKPNIGVSTAEAYGGVTPRIPSTPLSQRATLPVDMWQDVIHNGFEEHIFRIYPTLAQIKAELLKEGALYASMSGSGSTIYGIFAPKCNISTEFMESHSPYVLGLK